MRGSSIPRYGSADLEAMYQKTPSGEITLWCDGNVNSDEENRNRKKENPLQAHQRGKV